MYTERKPAVQALQCIPHPHPQRAAAAGAKPFCTDHPCKGTIVTAINIDIVNQIIYQRVAVESMVLWDFVKILTPYSWPRWSTAFHLIQQPHKAAASRCL